MTEMNKATDNIVKAVENDEIDVVGTVDITMANAYADTKKMNKHLQEVKDELEERAEAVITENPSTGPKIENNYTKLTLEESLTDFCIEEAIAPAKVDGRTHKQSAFGEDEGNRYFEYDMFTFVHELFAGQDCNTNPAPITPVIYGAMDSPEEVKRKKKVKAARAKGVEPKPEDLIPFPPIWGMRKMRKFLDMAVEDAQENEDARKVRVPQVATDGISTITISARKRLDLHDVVEACKLYNLECSEIKPYKNAYWNFYIDVKVPEISPGYPMMLVDFLADHDMEMNEVMPESFCRGYNKEAARVEKSMSEAENDLAVRRIIDKTIIAAANDGDTPLSVYKNALIAELRAAGLKFSVSAVKKVFDDAFDDEEDYEDD